MTYILGFSIPSSHTETHRRPSATRSVLGFLRHICDARQAKRSLGALSDRHLRDIGLTRDDVTDICTRHPGSHHVVTDLAIRADLRAKNW